MPKKFYQLSREERLQQLVAEGSLAENDADYLAANHVLPSAVAAHLGENQLGQFPLPYGIARTLMVNGVTRNVAMVGEEPSVVAAASNGARMALAGGGVQVAVPEHTVTGEVVFADVADPDAAVALISSREDDIWDAAAYAHPSIIGRGGGLKQVQVQAIGQFVKIRLVIDPQAAMGANMVNTIAEAVAHMVGQWLHQEALLAILSNYTDDPVVATVAIPVAAVATKSLPGSVVAARIAAASAFGFIDEERATTNNKGIMNGIEAATIALGNDYRAVSTAVHAYAAQSGAYQPLTRWTTDGKMLHGQLRVPLQLGVVGGATAALPLAQIAMRLGKIATVADAQAVLAALGLVQNLAALRALVGPGIQSGHMALQAGALAIAAGATGTEIDALTHLLQTTDKTIGRAKELLAQLRADKQSEENDNEDRD
ncbi:hydroxymethylglutaryl-CoA reductase, degradative [Lacticaseibacillus sharpeae]|uniref:hydroxymethylglutaryl-CoA reductase, degradative n=1 Tax=Lacticaseibacillus sharpeae TaxID=1626 RepID=UPI0007053487|nr:hydroxymethylglutaryl-CoA reductase, degradative [Lacticaseibacillus sharpeae]